jgi:hypothetical protein
MLDECHLEKFDACHTSITTPLACVSTTEIDYPSGANSTSFAGCKHLEEFTDYGFFNLRAHFVELYAFGGLQLRPTS